ncbi:DUF4162 domain-containing protein, partial [Nonomuraea sp. NPDC055795]
SRLPRTIRPDDEICVIDHGRVIAHGTPAELKQIVGGQTIVVRPKDPAELARAAELTAKATGREPASVAAGVLTVAVDGGAAFTAVVGALAEAGVEVAELSLRLPSLDEAFFALTGAA